jgi:Bacterial Ig domain
VAINEDAGQQTVNLSGISSGSASENQTLTVTASSSNTGLIPNPTVNYTSPGATGTLTFTPAAGLSGTATITVTVSDGQTQNSTVTRTFVVTVNAVNDPPTLNAIGNVTINEDAGQQTVSLSGISTGAANENQTLTVTASSSNTGLIPAPTVNYTSPNATGTLRFTPVADANGSATLTVTVSDGQAQTNRSFTVTVNAVNDPPTLNTVADMTINQDSGQQTVNLSGITSGAANENQTLSVTALSSNTGLIPTPTINYTSPNTTGSLRFSPLAGQTGTATITVRVSDGSTTASVTFQIVVLSVRPEPPTGVFVIGG